MSTYLHIPNPLVARMVEKQMRNWEFSQEQKHGGHHGRLAQVMDFVAISRSVGLAGDQVVAVLQERLGWPVFDKEILQAMAGDDDCRRQLYDSMDERDLGWLEEFLRSMTSGKDGKDDYFHRLTKTVLSLARKGHAIFLGRAADLILPRNVGLRVRIMAPRDYCVKQFAKTKGVSIEQARRDVEEIEHDRAHFIHRHFHVDAGEVSRHDLIINLERFTVEQAAEMIMAAMRFRGMAG